MCNLIIPALRTIKWIVMNIYKKYFSIPSRNIYWWFIYLSCIPRYNTLLLKYKLSNTPCHYQLKESWHLSTLVTTDIWWHDQPKTWPISTINKRELNTTISSIVTWRICEGLYIYIYIYNSLPMLTDMYLYYAYFYQNWNLWFSVIMLFLILQCSSQ